MSEKYEPEEKEVAQDVELKIVEPRGDKKFMVGFEGKTEKECQAYNLAISFVLEKAKLNPFHQVGVTPLGQNEPGYHAWEIWGKTTTEDLEKIIEQINQKAQENLLE